MKRLLLIALFLIVTPSAYSNEIAGTRVSGQGAVCAEGQGKAVEFNIALQQETSYCYERDPIPLPTQEQLEVKAQETIAKQITEDKNADAPVSVSETTVIVEPEVITETLTKVEVNVSTGVTTVSEFTESEKLQLAKDRAVDTARRLAKTEAETTAANNVGVRQCVNWQAEGQSGSECAFEPIPATEQEVADEFNALKELFDVNWFAILLAWLW